jgi:hypothetical protein
MAVKPAPLLRDRIRELLEFIRFEVSVKVRVEDVGGHSTIIFRLGGHPTPSLLGVDRFDALFLLLGVDPQPQANAVRVDCVGALGLVELVQEVGHVVRFDFPEPIEQWNPAVADGPDSDAGFAERCPFEEQRDLAVFTEEEGCAAVVREPLAEDRRDQVSAVTFRERNV